jgi:ABC-type Na+ efflux pump permease subunit
VQRVPQFVAALLRQGNPWSAAGELAFMLNLWLPLVAGIALADRLPRDGQLATLELLRSTATPRRAFVLGKYLGGLLAVSLQVFCVLASAAVVGLLSGAPPSLVAAFAMAFVAVNLPPLAFVAAFSIACPAVLPVRVYQVLFTGYWFWGNFLNPKALPTISQTVLVASGLPQARAFLGARFGQPVTMLFATLNLVTLAACAAVALALVIQFLQRQDQRA